MNPSSQTTQQSVQHKLIIIIILVLLFLVPLTANAQEVTEEPQVDDVATQEPVEEPTQVEEIIAPTDEPVEQPTQVEETVAPTDEPTVEQPAQEETEGTPEDPASTPTPEEEISSEANEVSVEATEEVVVETTEEPNIEVVETEEVAEESKDAETDEIVVVETPIDITEISENFEAWTSENWSVTDWSVAQIDDSNALFSTVANANAQVISLGWTNYNLEFDAKIEVGNTLSINFSDYTLILAADSRNRLSQNNTVIATSPTIEVTEEASSWHQVNISKVTSRLTVTVDDIPQYAIETTENPLGIFAFMPTGDQGVAIDNVLMTEIESDDIEIVEVISTPTPKVDVTDPEITVAPEATEEPDLLPEETQEPEINPEATEEPDLLAEATEEPDLLPEETQEPEISPEVTEEPVVLVEEPIEPTYIRTNVVSDDFEGDLSAWNTTASIVEVTDDNHVLLLSADGQLAPISSTQSGNVVITGQANIMTDVETSGHFTVTFSESYAVEINTSGIIISENGEIVTAVDAPQSANTWFAFEIEATATGIVVSINDVVVTEYAGELLLNGNFVVTTNTSVMFDNVSIDDLSLEEETEPLATPAPEVLTEESLNKLGGFAQSMIDAHLEGGEEAVTQFLTDTNAVQDEEGRILVDILVAKDFDGETITQLVTDAGGIVTRTFDKSIEAYVNVDVLIAITGNEGIRFIRNISRAVSTGPTAPVGTKGSDPTWTEGFNLLSIEEWNLAGVEGTDVKIGVVDIGFQKSDGEHGLNIPCLASTIPVYTPDGSGDLFDSGLPNNLRDHGTQIIEVICDIAPASEVYMFRADDPASLQDAISEARNPSNRMDILLITIDLGVNTSAGGGVSGSVDANVYGEIEAAKDDGMVVIAAAGNNNKRMLVLELATGNPGATTIQIDNMSEDDVVKAGWNDFDDNGSSIANIQLSLTGAGNSSSDDPLVNPLSISANSDGDLTLTIDPSSVSQTTFLQVQVVPADPKSDVQFDYASLTLNGDGLTTDRTDDDNVGNLGRPADSDHVISVGAICFRSDINPTRWEFSSNGPRFNSDGSPIIGWDATVTQDEAKPSLMSYSFVTTRDQQAAPEGEAPVDDLVSCSDGLGGTSAAAAHVAGMTALIMSNDANTSFDNLNEANATSDDTFNSIRDYLQARSVDLPFGSGADGFDTDYGAGLAILGAPTYDLENTVNLTMPADLLPTECNGSNTFYVGQASMDNTGLDGDLFSPFTSIAAALNATDPECVVVMPGEYVTPIFVENSYTDPLLVTGYNDVSRISTGDVIFWLRGLYVSPDGEYDYGSYPDTEIAYKRRAGLYFGHTSSNVEFSGFTFVAARIFTDSQGNTNASSPQAVVMDGSTDTTISNSQFGKISLNGVEYPGWNNLDATPLLVVSGTEGGRVENNIFNDNSVNDIGFFPTLAVVNSGASDNPVVIKGNEMYGNVAGHQISGEWGAILFSDGSHTDIINNAIYDNIGETIIKVATTPPDEDLDQGANPILPTHTRRARIVGNVFLNNTTKSDTGLKQPGALINARYAPMMYIINNTFVGNNIPTVLPFGQLVSRGNANSLTSSGSNGGSNPAGWDFWEFHSNLVYNNSFYELIGDTTSVGGGGSLCNRIPNDVSDSDLDAFSYGFNDTFDPVDDVSDIFDQRGAQNNWLEDNSITAPTRFGDCQVAIVTNKNTINTPAYNNQNIVGPDDNQPVDERQILLPDDTIEAQDGDFQGQDPESPFSTSDWQYYALGDTFIDSNDNSKNQYSDGIDAAKAQWLTDTGGGDAGDPYMDNADIEFDIVKTKRELDVNNWEINWLSTYGYDPSVAPPQGISGTDNGDFTVDIGAFEFSPLQFETNDSDTDGDFYNSDLIINVEGEDVDPVTANLEEDSDFITFDMSTVVTGGFGNLTFSINEQPNNYGTQCEEQFENTKGLLNKGAGFNEFFDYCPPPNFYTTTTDASPDNDYVSFEIKVADEAGAEATGEVRFTIDADPDDGIATNDDADFGDKNATIGDQLDSGQPYEQDVFEVVTTLGANVSVRLRPYVRYNNFFFSENGNPEFVDSSGKKLIDYPFEYRIMSVVEAVPGDPILEGTVSAGYSKAYSEDPILALELSDANTGSATITYRVRDARGEESFGNTLVIRSVSIIPDDGLHDDTSFIWNYSNDEDGEFFTQLSDYQTADVPDSGDWEALRSQSAINDTVHTTSTQGDTATFRFIGTGFTVFMRDGDENGGTFAVNIYDDIDADANDFEVPIFEHDTSIQTWITSTTAVNTLTIDLADDANEDTISNDSLTCTTGAGIDPIDQRLLVNDQDSITVTCNGLPDRKHTVQIVNTGGEALSVDAFTIINDGDLVFDDADPIPPGFHDVDNGVLRNAFGVQWGEVFDAEHSNGVALNALVVPSNVSFTITRASGFAIGTSYLTVPSSFNICVENQDLGSDGICSIVSDSTGKDLNGIHIPFFGLDPDNDYTITLTDMPSGFIFDGLVVFSDILSPVSNLPLGETDSSNFNLVLGEPFADDWEPVNGHQEINDDRSPIGPFIAFQMPDNIDTIGIKADNAIPQPTCSSKDKKRGTCPPPVPTGFSGLAVCVNRGNVADTNGTNYGNCIIIDSLNEEYDFIEFTDGTIQDGGSISVVDGTIIVPETLFDDDNDDDEWQSFTNNTVEIFSLYPDEYIEFTSIVLLSSETGLGEGSYSGFLPSMSFVDYDPDLGTFTEVMIDAVSGTFTTVELKECVKQKKGVCQEEEVIGTTLGTSGIGDAIIFKMQGVGLAPIFTETAGAYARVCIQEDGVAFSGMTDAADIAVEIQTNGDCQVLDISGTEQNSKRFINGIDNVTQYVMIELLPSPTDTAPAMNIDGIDVAGGDLTGLDPLTTGQRYETSFSNRIDDNQFVYIGEWQTKADTDGTRSGDSYDETDGDLGAGIVFKTTNGNMVNIIRELKTSTPEVCTGKKKNQVCTPGTNGYSDILVCVAPESNSADQVCTRHSSDGNVAQSILPVTLNSDYSIGDYIISISAAESDGFAIDAVEVLDVSSTFMGVGVYQDDSNLIHYDAGQKKLLKNTSFENSTTLLDNDLAEDWDWSISSGVSASIVTEDSFIGLQSAKLDGNTNDSLTSEAFDLVSGEDYTIVARVNVVSGTVNMSLTGVSGFTTQSSNFNNAWELLRHSFTATSSGSAQLDFAATVDDTSFFVDDVHVLQGGEWNFISGGLTDGQIAMSDGHGAKASFMFTGTGFTVKLASDNMSGENTGMLRRQCRNEFTKLLHV